MQQLTKEHFAALYKRPTSEINDDKYFVLSHLPNGKETVYGLTEDDFKDYYFTGYLKNYRLLTVSKK